MASLMIRNLDDGVKQALRERAAKRGVSMEQEARDIIARDVAGHAGPKRSVSVDDLMRLSKKPETPFDLTQAQREVWNYLYDDDRR